MDLRNLIQSNDLAAIENYASKLDNHRNVDQTLLNGGLIIASDYKNADVFKIFLEHGADTDYCNKFAIRRAIDLDCVQIIKVLHGKNYDLKNLFPYVYNDGSYHIIEYLLELDLKFDLLNSDLILNILSGPKIEVIKLILNRLSDPKDFLIGGSTKCACDSWDYSTIKLVLDLGADPNDNAKWIHRRKTPLEIVIPSNNIALVKLLLSYGAEPRINTLGTAGKNLEIFKLIYNWREWSIVELREVFSVIIESKFIESVWKYLHQIIADEIKIDDLRIVIEDCLLYSKFIELEYFINYYGKERILSLIRKKYSDKNVVQYMKEKYDFDLELSPSKMTELD